MTSAFDFSQYENDKAADNDFDFSKYEPKSGEPPGKEKGTSSAASIFGREFGAGAAGQVGDVLSLYNSLREAVPDLFAQALHIPPKVPQQIMPGTTEQLSELIQEKAGGRPPEDIYERFAESAGRFGGMEGAIGTVAGGPVGGVAGSLHGALTGAVYQAARELGAGDIPALGIASVATLSPVAFKELAPKLWSKFKKANPALAEEVLKTAPQQGKPPPPPPGGPPPPPPPSKPPIGPGAEIPQAQGGFELKERVQKALAPPEIKPIEIKPIGMDIPIREAEAKSLEGRVSKEPALGNAISRESFETNAQGGRQLSNEIKSLAAEEKKPVTAAYEKAEEITKTHNAIYPELAEYFDKKITDLESIAKRNAAEEVVYQQAKAFKSMVGEQGALEEVAGNRLMRQANSSSAAANYELPYTGYKGQIKEMVRTVNQSVANSLEAAGKDAARVKEADKMFARWADRFYSDEITPFLAHKVTHPEKLLADAINNPEAYRAVKNAIGSRKSDLINKVDREIVESKMGKYYKDPGLVNSDQYVKDLKNLNELIGKEKTAEADALLRKRKGAEEKLVKAKQAIRESPKKAKVSPSKTMLERVEKKAADALDITKGEDVDKIMNTRSGIRKLKKLLSDKGYSKLFEELKQNKIIELFREGKYGGKKLTGKDIVDTINKHYEVLEELMGKKELDELFKVGELHLQTEVQIEMIKKIGKTLIKSYIPYKAVKIILTGLPI